MAGGTVIDGRKAARAVLGHMRDGIQVMQSSDKFASIISLITSRSNAMPAGNVTYQSPCR